MRKREKEAGANGTPAAIDMDTLRASARAEQGEKSSRKGGSAAQHHPPPAAPEEAQDAAAPPPPTTQAHHEGSFQLTLATLSPSELQAQMHAQPPPPPVTSAWASTRTFAPDQLQHQSFLRTPQVVGAGQASPR